MQLTTILLAASAAVLPAMAEQRFDNPPDCCPLETFMTCGPGAANNTQHRGICPNGHVCATGVYCDLTDPTSNCVGKCYACTGAVPPPPPPPPPPPSNITRRAVPEKEERQGRQHHYYPPPGNSTGHHPHHPHHPHQPPTGNYPYWRDGSKTDN